MNLLKNKKRHILFKGDQNIFWDGFIYDLAIINNMYKVDKDMTFTPFIHDEKIGVSDQNISHSFFFDENNYFITEDYSDSAGDACYINIDTSFGLFYLPALEISRLETYGINIKAISKEYEKYNIFLDEDFIDKMSNLGLLLNTNSSKDNSFGSITNTKELENLFSINPKQRIYYTFTKSKGRYGIVPVKNSNLIISSIKLKESNIKQLLITLFTNFLTNGIMNQVKTLTNKIDVTKRIDDFKCFINNISTDKSISDFEILISEYLLDKTNNSKKFNLTKSSIIFNNLELYNISNYFLSIALSNTESFADSYDNSLNKAKLNIQRIAEINKYYNLPFYAYISDSENNIKRFNIYIDYEKKELYYKNNETNDLISFDNNNILILGKAIPFLNELRLSPNMIALPEHGSKYSPASDNLIKNLRSQGIDIPECKTLRVSINLLDNLRILQDFELILPYFLHPFFNEITDCCTLSKNWRGVISEIDTILTKLKEFKDGQDHKEADYIIKTNKFINHEFYTLLNNTILELNKMLNIARIERENQTKEFRNRKNILNFKIKLMVNYYKQSLLQVHDGLIYLNDRPYSIALYLMFGPEFINALVKNVTFKFESV
jgi:hypothetical protein